MAKHPECQLSMKDFTILEEMLDQDIHDRAFFRLLRQKLTNTTIVFHDEVRYPVAAIGSRVDFTIDGRLFDSRILVGRPPAAPSRLTLPVTTMRGLALLGLTAGVTIVVEWPEGESERIRVDKVYPPQSNKASSIIALVQRRKGRVSVDPDDDDPGPHAA